MAVEEIEEFLKKKLKQKENKSKINIKENSTNRSYDNPQLYEDIVANNQLWDIPVDEKITSHRQIVGPVIIFFKRIVRKLLYWHVTKPLAMQKNFNGSITRSLNEVLQYIQHTESKNELLMAELEKMANYSNELRLQNEQLNKHVKSLQESIISINEKMESDSSFDINYLEFENRFRGTEENIKNRQMDVYLPLLKDKTNLKVVDVGCGRGELVEGLVENDFDAVGIDLNKEMAEYSKNKGLNVIYGDALDYLNNVEDNTLGTIFSLHVFEHLSPNQIINFLKTFYRKLEKGGTVILETPNPECLFTLAYGFTIDLTHKKILHPYTMKFILEEVGFKDVKIKHLSPVAESVKLKEIDVNSSEDVILNENLQKLNNLLYSYQDYAIIATK